MGIQHTNKQKNKVNKPDITIKDQREKACKMMNLKISVDKNI